MSVILEFTIARESFALDQVLGGSTRSVVEPEHIVPVGGVDIPFFWIRGIERADLAARVAESDYIENLQILDRVDDRTLYRVEWTGEDEDLIGGLTASEATIPEASGEGAPNRRGPVRTAAPGVGMAFHFIETACRSESAVSASRTDRIHLRATAPTGSDGSVPDVSRSVATY